jgi:predicted AlkP superfamily phosphohydrolase/phosphomutase
MSRKTPLILVPIVIIALGLLISVFSTPSPEASQAYADTESVRRPGKVIVLGIDGLDYTIIHQYIDSGMLPNFKRLRDRGSSRPMTTCMPPQSPVAWSTFITGTNPGGHAIYDFVHRHPASYLPYSSMSEVTPPEENTRFLGIKMPNVIGLPGSYYNIPLSGGDTRNLRKGVPFWDILTRNDIPAIIHRVPVNFPPTSEDATTLSGMGTPDVQGSPGEYAYYTTAPPADYESATGGRIFPVSVENGVVEAKLYGPPNDFINYDKMQRTLVRKVTVQEHKASLPFSVYVDETNPVAKIEIDGQEIFLEEGVFSDWVEVTFSMLPSPGFIRWAKHDVVDVKGIVRFYLKNTHPDFGLYITPIQISPMNPALPISTPPGYATELAEAIGPYYTQGMPQDTKALDFGVFDDKDFVKQATIILEEEVAMAEYELSRFDDGLLFLYFSAIDQVGHMMWRAMVGEEHRAYNEAVDGESRGVLPGLYFYFDEFLGRVLDSLDNETCLMVMSDHGFTSWNRAFNLNRWLYDNGYLALKDGVSPQDVEFLMGVDWDATSIYGIGINGMHINQMGREGYGIIPPGAPKNQILDRAIEALEKIVDPLTGERVILNAYKADEIYSGPYVNEAPDVQIGYNRGYRVSDESAIGEISDTILEDNLRHWSGDHCADFNLVPGVLFSNYDIRVDEPALIDMAPTILSLFGIPVPEEMNGKPIF